MDAPNAQKLCDAADVLLLQGRGEDALDILMWGLHERRRDPTGADNTLLRRRLATALQQCGRYDDAARTLAMKPHCASLPELAHARMLAVFSTGIDPPPDAITESLCLRADRCHDELDRIPDGPQRDDLLATGEAQAAFVAGAFDQAKAHAMRIQSIELRVGAYLCIGASDLALHEMDVAIDEGKDELLVSLLRLPLALNLKGNPRFDALLERCGAADVVSGACRLGLPLRMLPDAPEPLEDKVRKGLLRIETYLLESRLQSELDDLTLDEYLHIATYLRVSCQWEEAEAVLQCALAKFPQSNRVKMTMAFNRLVVGERFAPKAIAMSENADEHYCSLVIAHGTLRPERRAEFVAHLKNAIAHELMLMARDPSIGAGERRLRIDRLRSLLVASLWQMGERGRSDAHAVMAGIEHPVARASALLWIGDLASAGRVLASLHPDHTELVWLNCPNVFTLQTKDRAAWGAFLRRAGLAEMAAGYPTLVVPRAVQQRTPLLVDREPMFMAAARRMGGGGTLQHVNLPPGALPRTEQA